MSILRRRFPGRFFIINPLFNLVSGRYIYHMNHFVDAHCHYDADAFCNYCGGGLFICNATCESQWSAILNGARDDNRIIPAIGIHPWHVSESRPGWDVRMRDVLVQNPHAMVGEIGLDMTRADVQVQLGFFQRQYEMAADLRRGVHIHCVHAWDAMLRVLRDCPPPPVIVMHRFSGSTEILNQIVSTVNNTFFSYQGISGVRTRRSVCNTPVNRILVESDAFGPAPDVVRCAVEQIADIRGMSTDGMSDTVYQNATKVIKDGQTA